MNVRRGGTVKGSRARRTRAQRVRVRRTPARRVRRAPALIAAGCALTLAASCASCAPAGSGATARHGATTPGHRSAASAGFRAAGRSPARVRYADAPSAPSAAPSSAPSSADADCTRPEASLNPASGPTDGPAVEAIRKRGRLVVGVDQNSYLWGFRDPATGQITGFDIDIVKAVARAILGDASKVQYLTVPTAQRIRVIQQHKVDMVVRTMTVNCQRITQVAFSTAYFEAGQQLLVPKGSSIDGFDDSLRGRTVCTAKGSTGLARLRQGAHGARVLTVDNQLDCLVRVQLGLADAVFTDNALAAGQAAQDPWMHLVGRPVTKEPYGVAMNLDAPDLVRRVNQVLAAYRRGGPNSPWMRSYRTWLAAQLPGITGPPRPAYK